MNYSKFMIKMREDIQESLGEAVFVDSVSVQKNNGTLLQGITIRRKGDKIVPTLYLEKFYEEYLEGKSLKDILEEFLEMYEQLRNSDVLQANEFDFLKSYEKVKKHLSVKLINKEKNKKLLEDTPYVNFLDMAIVFYCLVDNPLMGTATILIKDNHIKYWQVTIDTLYQDALENAERMLPGDLKTMEEILCSMVLEEIGAGWMLPQMEEEECPKLEGFMEKSRAQQEQEKDDAHMPLLVLTNNRKYFGAACILYRGLLEKFSEKIGQNFYILPSSVHEVILLPAHCVNKPEGLLKMVTEVNETQLDPEDVLTDAVYYYEKKTGQVSIYETKSPKGSQGSLKL